MHGFPSDKHLHSIMGGFESNPHTDLSTSIEKIYIPLWVDLKAICNGLPQVFNWIYIPLWVDLKEGTPPLRMRPMLIYIPLK